jgi:hypothetical protein
MSKTFAVSKYWGGSSSSALIDTAAGLELALELRAKRPNLVRLTERVDALIKAAPGCRPMLIERALLTAVGQPFPLASVIATVA